MAVWSTVFLLVWLVGVLGCLHFRPICFICSAGCLLESLFASLAAGWLGLPWLVARALGLPRLVARLLTCLCACLLASLFASLIACLLGLARLVARLLGHLPAWLLASLLA